MRGSTPAHPPAAMVAARVSPTPSRVMSTRGETRFRVVAQWQSAVSGRVPLDGGAGSIPACAFMASDTLPPDTEREEDRDTWPGFSHETIAELVDEQEPQYQAAWARYLWERRAMLCGV